MKLYSILVMYSKTRHVSRSMLTMRSFICFNLSFFHFRLDDTLKITDAAFEEIGEDRWHGACNHVNKLIEKMQEHDHYISTQCERVVINLGESSSESDDDSSTETASMGSSTDTASEAD